MQSIINWLRSRIAIEQAAEVTGKVPKFHVYEAADGWRWRLFATNGKMVAESGEAFAKRPSEKTLALIAGTFAKASIVRGLPS